MNKNLIFVCIAGTIVNLSIISIFVCPFINNLTDKISSKSWRSANCQMIDDYIDIYKNSMTDEERKSNNNEKEICSRRKAVYGLEHACFVINIFLGFVCFLFSFLHFLNIGTYCLRNTGIFGFLTGIIGFIITMIYIYDSCYIFNNDFSKIVKLNEDSSFAKWDDSERKFICFYFKYDEPYSFYAKFKDLNKNQYNYNKDYNQINENSKIKKCTLKNNDFNSISDKSLLNYCKNIELNTTLSRIRPKFGEKNENCDLLYYDQSILSVENKYIYNRWITTIFFGCLIIILNLGLSIFGFLIAKKPEMSAIEQVLIQ